MKTMTRDEITILYGAGGFVAQNMPFNEFWAYPPNYKSFLEPDWKPANMAYQINHDEPLAMIRTTSLVLVAVEDKMGLYKLAYQTEAG